MIKKPSILLSFILFLSSCSCSKKNGSTRHDYFIQAPIPFALIESLSKSTLKVINAIIQDSIRLELKDFDIHNVKSPFFIFKPRAAITLYYLYEINPEKTSYLFDQLSDVLKTTQLAQHVMITDETDFFGELKKDEPKSFIDLVVKIDDPQKELLKLHEDVKDIGRKAQAKHKREEKNGQDLYNVKKSEQFSYVPHLSLGHLRTGYISEYIKSPEKVAAIIDHIKQKIIEITSKAITKMPEDVKRVSFDRLSVYDKQQGMYIRDFALMLK